MLRFFGFASLQASVQDRPMLVNRLVPPPTARVAASTCNWLVGVLWTALTLVTGALCADRLNAHFGWWRSEVRVRTDTVSLPGAGTWLLPSSKPVPWRQVSPLQIRLASASSTPLIFTPRTDRVTEFPKLLFSCDKKGKVLLDSRWQLDPFFRAGTVKLVFPTVLPQALSIGGWLLLLGVVVLLSRAHGLRADAGFWLRLRAQTHRLAESVGRRPAVFLCLPSIYFLVVYPPLWKDVDALCQLVYGVSVSNIFHFPALFCTLARLPMWLGTSIARPGAFSPFTQQEPSLLGIYTLVLCQHALLIVSLRAFVVTSCATFFWRGAGVAVILLAPSLYAQVHLCGSESWSLIATVFLFASGLRILQKRPPWWRAWAAYALALVLAIGSRHINVLLGAWLVWVCLAFAVVSWGSRRCVGHWLVRAGVAGVILVLAIFCNRELANGLGRLYGIEPRSTLGRTLSDRIGTFLEKLRPEERVQLAGRLAAQTSDPEVQAALRIQATVGRFYEGGAEALTAFIHNEGLSGEHAAAQSDRAELGAMRLYLRSLHPKLLEAIRKDVQRGFTRANNDNLAISAFGGNFFTAIYAGQKPGTWESLAALRSARFPAAAVWFDVALGDRYLKFTHRLSVMWVTLILVAAWSVALFCRRALPEEILPLVGMTCAGAITFMATCVCVFYLDRYVLPLFTTVWLALAPSLELACRPTGSVKDHQPDQEGA